MIQTLITWYFSIYAVNKEFLDIDENANLQNVFAIEDFDIAMKSLLPVQYFKKYISENNDEAIKINEIIEGGNSHSRNGSVTSFVQNSYVKELIQPTQSGKLTDTVFTLF